MSGEKLGWSGSYLADFPEVVKQLHPTRNTELDVKKIRPSSNLKLWWKCYEGPDHEWDATVKSRIHAKTGCPFCGGTGGKRVSITNCLLTISSTASLLWHPTRNGDITPRDILAFSNKKFWWKCPKGEDHEWEAPPARIVEKQLNENKVASGCPFCAGKRVSVTNSLANLFPEIAKQWHPILNESISPNDITSGTNKRFWWKCSEGLDHIWENSPASRTHGKGNCPFCVGQRVSVTNSLSTRFPEIAESWHPTLNGDTSPEDIVSGSNKKFWWKCSVADDHVWQTSPMKRISGRKCPCCAGKKIVESNCLATTHPELLDEWHPLKNGGLGPREIGSGSGKMIWWKCSADSTHPDWRAPPARRTGAGAGCNVCGTERSAKKQSTPDPGESFLEKYPEIAKEWHPTKNGDLTPSDIRGSNSTKVWWKCSVDSEHEWITTPHNRTNPLLMTGCARCSGNYSPNTEEWIALSKKKFGNKFDYSETEYTRTDENITLVCNVHGEIKIWAGRHLRSPTGCTQCSNEQTGMNQRRSQESVIAAFIEQHGNRYDYSKVEYKGDKHNVLIICRVHGEFWQRAIGHANGLNCNDCMNIEAGLNRRLNREDIIARAIEVHGPKYDYSKFEYETIEDYMVIICPEHGDFVQKVNNHVNQENGCPKCGLIESGLNRRITKEEWIERFIVRHGDLYDYSKFKAVLTSEKGTIICREHGEFLQAPSSHAKGHGCSLCLKKNQTLVYDFVKEIFSNEEVVYDYRHPDLRFKKSNAKMELDIWLPNLSLGIEYQGEQHYEEFWQGYVELRENQTLNSTLARDEEKRIACKENEITLIEIPYTWNATIDYVKDALHRHGIEFDMV